MLFSCLFVCINTKCIHFKILTAFAFYRRSEQFYWNSIKVLNIVAQLICGRFKYIFSRKERVRLFRQCLGAFIKPIAAEASAQIQVDRSLSSVTRFKRYMIETAQQSYQVCVQPYATTRRYSTQTDRLCIWVCYNNHEIAFTCS
jgi:hypothetical protein